MYGINGEREHYRVIKSSTRIHVPHGLFYGHLYSNSNKCNCIQSRWTSTNDSLQNVYHIVNNAVSLILVNTQWILVTRASCYRLAKWSGVKYSYAAQQTQNICITFMQCRTNVEDVGPALYKCYTNVLCLRGGGRGYLQSLYIRLLSNWFSQSL